MDKNNFKKQFKKRLYNLTLEVIKSIEGLPKDVVSRRLGDQLLRSGTSVIANYIEGQSASSKKEFINFLNISLKSANETKLWLSLLKDSGKMKPTNSEKLISEFTEIAKILASSLITLRNKKL